MADDRPYDHLMLYQGMPFDLKVRRLLVEERWVFVVGLCLASYAPGEDRGSLVVSSGAPIDPKEIAEVAEVDVGVVESALGKMSDSGLLIEIDEATGAMRYAMWDRHNPKRKASDSREAWRDRKRKQREREKAVDGEQLALEQHAELVGQAPQTVMDDRSATGLRALDTPPFPARPSGNRKRDRDRYRAACEAYGAWLYPDADPRTAGALVMTAIGCGAGSPDAVKAFIADRHTDFAEAAV